MKLTDTDLQTPKPVLNHILVEEIDGYKISEVFNAETNEWLWVEVTGALAETETSVKRPFANIQDAKDFITGESQKKNE